MQRHCQLFSYDYTHSECHFSACGGMVQFNADAHKLQVYAMLTDNNEIFNSI
jgi:hypothetical protein